MRSYYIDSFWASFKWNPFVWIYKWTPIVQDTIEILLCGSQIKSLCGELQLDSYCEGNNWNPVVQNYKWNPFVWISHKILLWGITNWFLLCRKHMKPLCRITNWFLVCGLQIEFLLCRPPGGGEGGGLADEKHTNKQKTKNTLGGKKHFIFSCKLVLFVNQKTQQQIWKHRKPIFSHCLRTYILNPCVALK